ncbi:hypothetical protein ABEB36_000787 [Hypothenemus hampei]|uniref:Uncharacterized protein n=1 Tax=Hypothenemus hampei TaxID=57062 RepID=A0ABD1FCE4_HYPHA
MEEEIRKIINSVSFKVELLALLTGVISFATVVFTAYDLMFYEDRLFLQVFLGKDSTLFHIARICCCFFLLPAIIPTIALPIFHNYAFEATHLYASVIGVGGFLLGLSPLLAMFTYNAPKGPALMLLSNYILFLYALCDVTQEYLNIQEHLLDVLYDLKWYLWDVKCQKCYLLMMGQFSNELKIPVMFVYYIGLEIFEKFIRLTYTAANCLLTLGKVIA